MWEFLVDVPWFTTKGYQRVSISRICPRCFPNPSIPRLIVTASHILCTSAWVFTDVIGRQIKLDQNDQTRLDSTRQVDRWIDGQIDRQTDRQIGMIDRINRQDEQIGSIDRHDRYDRYVRQDRNDRYDRYVRHDRWINRLII